MCSSSRVKLRWWRERWNKLSKPTCCCSSHSNPDQIRGNISDKTSGRPVSSDSWAHFWRKLNFTHSRFGYSTAFEGNSSFKLGIRFTTCEKRNASTRDINVTHQIINKTLLQVRIKTRTLKGETGSSGSRWRVDVPVLADPLSPGRRCHSVCVKGDTLSPLTSPLLPP